jgi:hypothetical protein
VTATDKQDHNAPDERVRQRWDEVGAALQRAIVLGQQWEEVAEALEGANVLGQLAELARVPKENRVEFCRQLSSLLSDMWTFDADSRALVLAKQNKSISRAIDTLRAARQALADLDEEFREALRGPIIDIEKGTAVFLACLREESAPAHRRAYPRGRRPGTAKNWLFAAFVVKLKRMVKAAGGRLGLQKTLRKENCSKLSTSSLPTCPTALCQIPGLLRRCNG